MYPFCGGGLSTSEYCSFLEDLLRWPRCVSSSESGSFRRWSIITCFVSSLENRIYIVFYPQLMFYRDARSSSKEQWNLSDIGALKCLRKNIEYPLAALFLRSHGQSFTRLPLQTSGNLAVCNMTLMGRLLILCPIKNHGETRRSKMQRGWLIWRIFAGENAATKPAGAWHWNQRFLHD
jgi:hypothetical protein